MSPNDAVYLLDMLNAARDGLTAVAGITRDEFLQNPFRRSHARVSIEILGEAAGNVAESTRNAHPEIAWRAIIGMRNQLVHGYRQIDWSLVWDTVILDLPALIALLEPLVPPDDEL